MKKLVHTMTMMHRYENPDPKWWDNDYDESKFWCSCGFKWNLGLRQLGEHGYELLIEAHQKWVQELKQGEGNG